MNGLNLIKKSAREYPPRSLRTTPNFRNSMPLHKSISALMLALALTILFGMAAGHVSYGASTSGNATQTSSTVTTATISIAFDLPTAAVATFVLVLLGLAAGLLLMMRLSHSDHSAM